MAQRTAYSIGFTKHSAEAFFGKLIANEIELLIDVRLNAASQLAGFAKRADLQYFLNSLCHAEYLHEPLLTPTDELLGAYRKKEITWSQYEQGYSKLLQERQVEHIIPPSLFDKRSVLLCSEATAERCHRRLALEHLAQHWGRLNIIHL